MVDGASELVPIPLAPSCGAIIVVPVRNEEKSIESCLAAFTNQQSISDNQFEVILLFNNCTDRSHSLVQTFALTHRNLRIHLLSRYLTASQANIGTVRRILMDEACARFFRAGKQRGAILTTDADTIVENDWIAKNLEELKRGPDAVGGRISLHRNELRALLPRVRRRYFWETAYSLLLAKLECQLDPVPWDPWPRHRQNFCGSLAVSALAYRRAGGIPAVENLEDIALCGEILKFNGKIRHSPFVKVRTSARLDGRVGVGLSSHLKDFYDGEAPMVENVWLAAKKFEVSHILRQSVADYSRRKSIFESIDREWTQIRDIPIDLAIRELQRMTNQTS